MGARAAVKMPSVLQEWVRELPLREQGTLLTGVRGCDLTPKLPLESTERQLVAFLRYCFMVCADPREIDREPGCFHISRPPASWRASELGHYPQHWYSHLMHCFEIVGYRHPDYDIREMATDIYLRLVEGLHLNPESFEEMKERLSEDRIAKGTVVQ